MYPDSSSYDYSTYTEVSASEAGAYMAFFMPFLLIGLVLAIFMIGSLWKLFTKAGKPGWAAIVPFYNSWVLAEVGGKPGWWGLLAVLVGFIPFVGAIVSLLIFVIIADGVAKRFGKDTGYTILLVLLPFIGFPMLAFGDAKYSSTPVVTAAVPPPTPSASTDTTDKAKK